MNYTQCMSEWARAYVYMCASVFFFSRSKYVCDTIEWVIYCEKKEENLNTNGDDELKYKW